MMHLLQRTMCLAILSAFLSAPLAVFAESGREIAERRGCLNCHSTDGSRKSGPTFKGLYGSERTVLRGEDKVTLEADEAYLRRSIVKPADETVEGYAPAMPVFNLPVNEIDALIDYLKGL